MTLLEASNLLEKLRAETRAQHDALHVHPLLAPLNRPDVTHDQYRDALTAFDAFIAPWRLAAPFPRPKAYPTRPSSTSCTATIRAARSRRTRPRP